MQYSFVFTIHTVSLAICLFVYFVLFQSFQQREAFIATQAPLDSTVVDFWRMAWEYEAYCIMMLSTLTEKEEVRDLSCLLHLSLFNIH